MRHDMARVIINIPRTRSIFAQGIKTRMRIRNFWGSCNVDENEWDEFASPKRVSRRYRHYDRWDTKSQNDRLSPLFRFLLKSVGRFWGEVWSDICFNASLHSVDGNHLRDHVRNYVNFGNEARSYQSFFVGSDDVLRQRENEKFVPVLESVNKIVVSETQVYELQEGYWFEVKYRKLPKGELIYRSLDGTPVLRDRDSFEKISSRQIGRKELKVVKTIINAPKSFKRTNLREPLVLHGKNQYGGVQRAYVSGKFRNLLEVRF